MTTTALIAVSLVDLAALGTALFTALAALAALLTARQGRKMIEAAERPILDAQVLADPAGLFMVAIVNTGRGVARGARYLLHAQSQTTGGVLTDGYLQPGEKIHVQTAIGPAPVGNTPDDIPDLAVMVSCRDAEGFAHYWTHDNRHRVPRTRIRRRPRYPDRHEVLHEFFPHVDLDAAKEVGSALQRPEPGLTPQPRE